MKTVNVYNFEELSEKAQQKAISDYRNQGHECPWMDEALDSVRAFCQKFGVSLEDYEIGGQGSFLKTDASNANFRGLKLASINPEEMITGYCLDYDLMESFHSVFKMTGDALHAFKTALDSGLSSIESDMNYHNSDEAICETMEASDYQFLEDGRMI